MMKPVTRLFGTIATVLFLAACQTYTLVGADTQSSIGNNMRVQTTSAWSVMGGTGSTQVWTIDGRALHQIVFVTGKTDGQSFLETVYPGVGVAGTDVKYEDDLSAIELVERFESAILELGFADFDLEETAITDLSGRSAVRLDFTARSENSPLYRGIAFLVQTDVNLHSVTFIGTDLYHFGRDEAEFLNLIDTVEWLDVASS